MISIEKTVQDCKSFIEELKSGIHEWVEQRIEKRLRAQADQWLGRDYHQGRHKLCGRKGMALCQRCGSRQVKDFSRNGHRARQMVTTFGVVNFGLPRVKCQCGGSVRVPFGLLQPYQRLWDDVATQIGRLANWGVSLRHMQDLLGEQAHTAVGLSTLNRIVHNQPTPVELTLTSVPPVVLLDAIWVTLLEEGDGLQTDACGRQRQRKHKVKVCVLVALGIYPQTGGWGILSWDLAEGETQSAWEALLVALDTRGLYRQRGLELLIHDGAGGLVAALKQVYPHIPHQRCLFHKLRNLQQAIVPPHDLPRRQRRAFKTALMHLITPIFEASDEQHARTLTDDFADRFQTAQPRLVERLRQDWADNFAFLRVLARFPHWQRRYLRTTSLLERVNRMIRRLFRSAGAFHSRPGLCAAVTRVLAPLRLI